MKKMLMMVLMAIVASTANAQVDVSKQVLKMKNYDEAATLLKSNLDGMTAEAKAKCYNKLVDLSWAVISKEAQEESQSDEFYTALINAFNDASECNKYDNQPNAKGQVKPKFHNANRDRLYGTRPFLINGGENARQKNDLATAYKFWGLYVDSAKDPLFAEVDQSGDQYLSDIAYYAAVLAYQNKDYAGVDKYTDVALLDAQKAKDAMEVKLMAAREGLKTKADSVAYVDKLESLYARDHNSEVAFGSLVDMYTNLEMNDKLEKLFNEKLMADPNNFTVWAIRGQKAMQAQQLENAIEYFKKALMAQPDNASILTFLGACQLDRAAQAEDKVSGKTGRAPKAAMDQIRPLYEEAKANLEKARKLDPNRTEANWAYPLYRVYYSLKENDKVAELEPLINN